MAKLAFTKLGLKTNNQIKTVLFNEQEIEVKQYLPINEKLEMISNVINLSADDNNFANPVKVSVFTTLEILFHYTNITFTEKQKEDPVKLYDLVISNGLMSEIIKAIPEGEYAEVLCGIEDSVNAVYAYRNSVLGIMDTISADYSNLNLDATEIQKKLGDPENMAFLKTVVKKLG
jgi:hypothetical protein